MLQLETARLIVRELKLSDAPEVAAFFARERDFHDRFGPHRPPLYYTTPYWRKEIPGYRRLFREGKGLRLFLFLKTSSREPIGLVGISEVVRGAFHAGYLGYLLGQRHEGKGLMSEALGAVIKYAFDEWNLHRLMANYLPDNNRSAAVLKRHGFTIEGTARDYLHINGEWRDHVMTSLVNEKWRLPKDMGL